MNNSSDIVLAKSIWYVTSLVVELAKFQYKWFMIKLDIYLSLVYLCVCLCAYVCMYVFVYVCVFVSFDDNWSLWLFSLVLLSQHDFYVISAIESFVWVF